MAYMFSVPGATIDINGIDVFMHAGWAGHAANSVTVTIEIASAFEKGLTPAATGLQHGGMT